MASYRIGQAAELLGVTVDTVRRWIDAGDLPSTRTAGGQRRIEGPALAALAAAHRRGPGRRGGEAAGGQSARNRLTGIVTKVTKDEVMAQVELQAGPYRLVSLMTREAADELELTPGVLAVAVVKATNVVVERPG
ncbi:MAG TPA: helix-turn-helix transcriptional regulator [Acidimicrobiales bacterium]|nr:helix-turn-helix transcriptional regulator [Acidimicrobiales bacterium]